MTKNAIETYWQATATSVSAWELVVAEHGWERVRSASRVDDRASGVGEPPDAEQCDRRRIESGGELRQDGDACPAQRHAEHCRYPIRCFDPGELEHGRRAGADPDHHQH